MLDIKFIRENPDIVKEAVKNKKADVDVDKLLAVDARRRELIESVESLKSEQNKKSRGPQSPESIKEARSLKDRIKVIDDELSAILKEYRELMFKIPNIPTDDTPIGPDETANKVLREWGKIRTLDFKPKEHWELGRDLDILDNERASKVSGTRFSYLKSGAAMLEFALIQFILLIAINEKELRNIARRAGLKINSKPFVPVIPPVLIKPDVLEKMGRLEPKDDRYYIPGDDLYLAGSAEHTLGPMHMEESFNESELPIRYIGFSTAFRREAGSYGKDTKGILRVHQFDKLEFESFCLPENSVDEQNFFVTIQEYIMQALEIPYRVVAISTGDMGMPDAKQIDIETWMPGQNSYRETHTADLMTDFQSRRLGIKVKRSGRLEFVHMNDATAAAGRTIIAILENYQTEKGTIIIPKVLKPFMFGIKEIK